MIVSSITTKYRDIRPPPGLRDEPVDVRDAHHLPPVADSAEVLMAFLREPGERPDRALPDLVLRGGKRPRLHDSDEPRNDRGYSSFSASSSSAGTRRPSSTWRKGKIMGIAIRTEHLSKEYRLGIINHGMLFKDIQSWVARKRGKPDPHEKIGAARYEDLPDRFWASRTSASTSSRATAWE